MRHIRVLDIDTPFTNTFIKKNERENNYVLNTYMLYMILQSNIHH